MEAGRLAGSACKQAVMAVASGAGIPGQCSEILDGGESCIIAALPVVPCGQGRCSVQIS